MHVPLQFRNKPLALVRQFLTFNLIGPSLLLSTGAVLCLNLSAKAADRVVLRLESSQVTVPITNIQTFVATGEPQTPEFQDFAQKHPRLREILQKTLDKPITFDGRFKERLSKSSVGEFLLNQVDQIVNSGGTGVQSLRIAFQESLKNDNQVSFLELLSNYPGSQVYLDVAALERGYDKIQTFVERIEPKLEAIKATLQDLICDCEQPAAKSKSLFPSSSPQSSVPRDLMSTASQPVQSGCSQD